MVVGTPRYMAPEQADRRSRRRPQRSLRGRRHPLRDAGRTSGLCRPIGCRSAARHALRAAAGPDRIAGGRRRRPRHSPSPGEAARGTAAIGGCDGRGAARHQRRRARTTPPCSRMRSRVWSCCRFVCCDPIRRPTFWPSACPTRSRRRCRAYRLAGAAIERRRGTLRRRSPGSQSAGHRGGRRPRGDGHAAALGRSVARAAQLVEAPGGTLLTSHTVQSSMGELFRLQDDIAHRIVEALSLPLAGGAPSPTPDAPHDARGYELYLRANELARTYAGLVAARDLYQQCVELDSRFAPAWARLGRCYRVIGKYVDSAARQRGARRRCVPPRPRTQPAPFHRAQVLRQSRSGHRSCPAGDGSSAGRSQSPRQRSGALCRARPRLSLLRAADQSLAAHAEARRLDPNVQTGFEQTLLIDRRLRSNDGRRAAARSSPAPTMGFESLALGMAGRARRSARAAARDATVLAHSDVSVVGGSSDGLARSSPRRFIARHRRRSGAIEDLGRPRGNLPGRVDALRRRRIRGGPGLPAALDREGLLTRGRRFQASRQFDALRGNPAFQAVMSRSGGWPPTGAGGVSGGGRRTPARHVKPPRRRQYYSHPCQATLNAGGAGSPLLHFRRPRSAPRFTPTNAKPCLLSL